MICPCLGGGMVVSLCHHLRVSLPSVGIDHVLEEKQSCRPAVKALRAVLSSASAQREYSWLKRPAYSRSDSSGLWRIVYKLSASDRSGRCVERQTVSSVPQMSLLSQVEDNNTNLELRQRGWRGREDIALRRCASDMPW
ncbi:hypothetical protein ACFX1R_014319 [Malus domestica]